VSGTGEGGAGQGGSQGGTGEGGGGEPLSREDFEAEFGASGVENPNVVDLIEAGEGTVTLVMNESRGWGGYEQLRQIEEKINRYLGYVLDGYLVQHYPEHEGEPVTIRLECRDEPAGDVLDFLAEARAAIEGVGVGFEVRTAGSA
jgi:hypothetical protein